jgi:hypothetical protein
MDESIIVPPADDQAAFELGEMLGRRQAFGTIAGRCSAADAECLRRMRDEKLFASRSASWDEFCPKYLGLSSRHANRIIGHLEEFGPSYFELAQLTRVTPEQFRAIAPAVRDQSIHMNGEAIALIPENAEKIAAAVAGLRREAAPPEPVSGKDDAAYIVDRHCARLLSEIRQVVRAKPKGTNKIILRSTIHEVIVVLRALDLEMGI